MAKTRSITKQLEHAIGESQHLGESKRSYKRGHGGDTGERIYGIEYSDSIYKYARQFGAFMKSEHPDIKLVRDIKQEHVQAFIDYKAKTCAQTTVGTIISNLTKIERCVQKEYYRKADWGTGRLINTSLREGGYRRLVATDSDYERLMAVLRPSEGRARSNAWRVLPLSRYAGLRLKEGCEVHFGRLTTTGGKYGFGTLTIQGKADGAKGGRWRTIDLPSGEARAALIEACKGCVPGGPLLFRLGDPSKGILEKSVSDMLHRGLRAAGLDPEKWRWNTAHPFRKQFAQEIYDITRAQGVSKREAADAAHDQLGHGPNRKDLDHDYIKNMW